MDLILNDVRFALRSLRKQPAFATTAVATLALAIGASTAIFSVVDATLLRPLPFHTPERIVFAWGVAGPQRSIRGASFAEAHDWIRLNRSFEQLAIYDETTLNLRTATGADRVEAEMVSASYFSALSATPQLGRVFTPDEDRVPDANPVVVISDGMWTTRFARDRSIVGRTLTLNDLPFTVLGVMRPGFKGLSFDTDVWFPAAMTHAAGGPRDLNNRSNRWLATVGRLNPGVTLKDAQTDAERVAAEVARAFPANSTDGRSIELFSLRDSYLGSTRTLVLAVFTAVGLLLLIACANIVGLQLVRASARRRELALRIAIGADRRRIVQQLVVEGLVLSAAATVLGIIVAHWGSQALVSFTPAGLIPNYATPSINLLAFAFAVATSAGCGMVFGLVPAMHSARIDLTDALKEGSRGSAAGFGRGVRLGSQQLLVVGETAVSLVLLIGAGLYVRSLQKQLAVSPGFDPRGLLRARIIMSPSSTPEARIQFLEQFRDRLAAMPSVRAVAIGSDMPLGGVSNGARVYLPERNETFRYFRHSAAPDFFTTLGVRLVGGRAFTKEDRSGMPAVVMISESMARRFWPDQNPIGKVMRTGDETGPEVRIVGVVQDFRQRDLTTTLATTEPDIYYPLAQRTTGEVQLAIRSDLPAETIAASVRGELAALDPAIALFGVQSFDALLAQQTASGRFASTVLGVFGAAALVLTAVGLYGVLAFLVSLRLREIGIRMALGATYERVAFSVLAQGLRLVIFGAAAGTVVALLATQVIARQLYATGPRDPVVFAGVPLLLVAVAACAAGLPARRAARVDPQIALRSE